MDAQEVLRFRYVVPCAGTQDIVGSSRRIQAIRRAKATLRIEFNLAVNAETH